MTVTETGWQPETLLAGLEDAPSLLDQAAQAHAEAIVEVARDYGYLHHVARTIERTGEGVRVITDPGTPMTWLAGKRVPLRGVAGPGGRPVIRTATAQSIAAGKWRYPGREQPMADADQDPRVRAVVEEQLRRLTGGG